MQWKHSVSFQWMKARQTNLTATDIRKLIPYTKSGNKRTVSEDTKLEIAASKIQALSEDDCVSVGAAARGHLLEPFAINAYNQERENREELFHVDDLLISKKIGCLGLGFSPDAVSLEAHNVIQSHPHTWVQLNSKEFLEPFVIGEVKCYSPGKHLVTANGDKSKLEERWQIATAMAVCDNIEKAHLILYCPDLLQSNKKLFSIDYSKDDLFQEINIVYEVFQEFEKWFFNFLMTASTNSLYCSDCISEIEQLIEKERRLNPC